MIRFTVAFTQEKYEEIRKRHAPAPNGCTAFLSLEDLNEVATRHYGQALALYGRAEIPGGFGRLVVTLDDIKVMAAGFQAGDDPVLSPEENRAEFRYYIENEASRFDGLGFASAGEKHRHFMRVLELCRLSGHNTGRRNLLDTDPAPKKREFVPAEDIVAGDTLCWSLEVNSEVAGVEYNGRRTVIAEVLRTNPSPWGHSTINTKVKRVFGAGHHSIQDETCYEAGFIFEERGKRRLWRDEAARERLARSERCLCPDWIKEGRGCRTVVKSESTPDRAERQRRLKKELSKGSSTGKVDA